MKGEGEGLDRGGRRKVGHVNLSNPGGGNQKPEHASVKEGNQRMDVKPLQENMQQEA